MKIILIEPPAPTNAGIISRFYGSFGTGKADFIWPPLELMGIAGYLNKDKPKIKTIIYDASGLKKTLKDIQKLISQEKPDIVIFSTSTSAIYSDLLVTNKVKEVSPNIITIAVGAHIMALPEETLKLNSNLDIAVYSDGQEIIIKNITESPYELSKIKGIYYRDKNKVIKKNQPEETTNNLDQLGFPAHDQIPKEIYHDFMTKKGPLTLIMAQRGCVNKCTFCNCPALYKYRERSVNHIIEELKWIKKLGYREFKFVNAGITYNLNWTNELMDKIISNRLNLNWWANVRADNLSPQILDKIKKAGCHTLAIGLESADPQILKNIRKNILPEQVRKAVLDIKKIGIETAVYFILGLPGETKETMQTTIDFAKSLPVDYITLGVAQPTPGTGFYNLLKEKNFLLTDDWSKYDPVQPPVYQYPHLSSQEIFKTVKSGYRQFYFRPSYILKKAAQVRSFNEFKIGLKNFTTLIKRYVLSR